MEIYWESGRDQTKKTIFTPICRKADMTDFTYFPKIYDHGEKSMCCTSYK